MSFISEDFPVIDTDSDPDESEKSEEDSGKHFSDCESEPLEGKPEDLPVEPSHVSGLFIRCRTLLFPCIIYNNGPKLLSSLVHETGTLHPMHDVPFSVGDKQYNVAFCV